MRDQVTSVPPPEGTPGRAPLKVYLGYASHTGKTWRLLEEARRRKARGEDVVVGWVRTQDRPQLSELLTGLEVIPAREGALDLEAILGRAPRVCVIDELAHSNPAGSRHPHRWQDVEALLNAGIAVVTAMNIQYLEGLRSSITGLLGSAPEETVPDDLVRGADEVLVVDASPDSVAARAMTGSEPTLSTRALLELRELALLYSAAAVDEEVLEYRHEHHIGTVWETRERVLVCITAYGRAPYLIQRGAQTAERWKGELWAIYVTPDATWSNLSREDADRVRSYLDLARARGARVEIVEDADPARGILSFARQRDITKILLGHAAAYPFRGALSRTVAGRILHEAAGIDVHLVSDDPDARPSMSNGPGLSLLARLLSGQPRPESRGHLRIYLGYAPGVGKTFQMLLDARYLRDQGQEVVVGYCQTRGRQDVQELLDGLEAVPSGPEGPDVEALVRRHPRLCLLDDLAERSRWREVEALRDTGIHVFTTLDVFEVESLKDTVECITDVDVRETVPDWLVDEADEVLLVDVPSRALLNRLKRGAVYPGTDDAPESMDTLFNEGCLQALRELAMRLTAERVEDELEALEKSPEKNSAEALLVCVHNRPSGASAIRRAWRTGDRLGAPVHAVFVAPDEDWAGITPEARQAIEANLALARTLHIDTHVLYGSNVARTLVDFAIRHGVTRIFLGRSHKTGWREFFQRSVIEQVIRLSPGTDVCVVSER
ncbi:MAG: universal stress protein [Candidatus Eremiobacterota bacterium]